MEAGVSASRGELPAATAQQVEDALDVEAAEDVDVHDPAVGQRQEQLEVGAGHAHHLPAELAQLALHPEGLPDDVGRVGVPADVGQVGVGVVADHLAVPDGAEEAAVAHVGVDADLVAEVGDGAGRALDDLAAYVVVGLGEDAGQVPGLVDREGVAVAVAEARAPRRCPRRSPPRRSRRARRPCPRRAPAWSRRAGRASPPARPPASRPACGRRRAGARTTRRTARRR